MTPRGRESARARLVSWRVRRALLVMSILAVGCDGRDTRGDRDAGPASLDAGSRDGGVAPASDGAIADAALVDAALADAGPVDASGPRDAATDPAASDAGALDAGADAGPIALDAGHDAGVPPRADHHVHIDVDNFCNMAVSPTEITIPAGQTAYFDWHNHSADYPVDVWMSYGGGYLELETGATWDEPVSHCATPSAHTEYADISTACSEHRFLIHCN